MVEIDDYNQEHFFELEANWDDYQSMIEEWIEPTPQEKDASYNIFTLEQAISTIKSLERQFKQLNTVAENATIAIENFIEDYTEIQNEGRG